MKRALICLLVFMGLFAYSIAGAEIKIFEQEVEETVSRGQSQEQVEAFALQKAKRLAVEEAGTYISSLTVVRNYQLQSDEVTALASGVVQAKIVGVPAVRLENGIVHVKVKARIDVDTSVLDRQVQEIMKEKGILKKLEDAQKKNRELEEKLANLKSSEVKRLEELNTQTLALERERDRQRLIREEQSLKAKGALSQAEADRIANQRAMQERISQTMAEQERAKRNETAALAAEQDRIKRAQMENEQRWNDLARKAKISQDSWAAIDDSLSLRQALTEVIDLKREIANLKGRLDYQHGENTKNMTAAYAQQRALTTAKLPQAPAPMDGFETTAEYNARIAAYDRQVKKAKIDADKAIAILEKEEALKSAEAKVEYLGQQLRVLAPFVQRLKELQERKFAVPERGSVKVELGAPDADNSRFPIEFQHNGKSWSAFWDYSDRNQAKDFYRTRIHLTAKGLFQIDEAPQLRPKLTAVRVIHLGTKETREFNLEVPRIFSEIDQFGEIKQEEIAAKDASKKALIRFKHKEIGNNNRFFMQDDGTVIDIQAHPILLKKIQKGGRFFAIDDENVLDVKTGLTLIVIGPYFTTDEGTVINAKTGRIRKKIGEKGRFIAYDDGTVLDTQTNLMWADHDNGSDVNWYSARRYCEGYSGGGYTDWRMPTIDELKNLYDNNKQNRHGYYMTDLIQITFNFVWASDTRDKRDFRSQDSEAAYFGFNRGTRDWGQQSGPSTRALPVRSGK